jgi:WD40 repeat protein
VALSADGKTAVSVSSDKTVKVWDVETGQVLRTLEGHTSRVMAVMLTPDGKTAVSGSRDRTLKVWGVETGYVGQTLKGHTGTVYAVALGADGKMAVSGSNDKTLKAWDVKTGSCLASFTGEAPFTAFALSRTMRVFAGDAAGHVHLLELRLGS